MVKKNAIKNIRLRMEKALGAAPDIKEILISPRSLDEKRAKLRELLSILLADTFDDNPTIPSMEWVIKRDANRVFRNILSKRSEKLAGFGFLEYMDQLLHQDDLSDVPMPDPGFLAEFEHLLKGVTGTTGIYKESTPAFVKYEGVAAAKVRSQELARMASRINKFADRYAYGLNEEYVRMRSRNKARIMSYFKATENEWRKWTWHVRHIIKDADVLKSLVNLTEDEYEAVKLAREYRIPFGITPHYLSLIDEEPGGGRDAAVRAQVIPTLNYVEAMKQNRESAAPSMDFMLERNTSPIEGITRRYPSIVILKPVLTCPQICVYCQRNWEIEDVHSRSAVMPQEKLDAAVKWIADRPEIMEVLVTGGDPLLLSDSKLDSLLSKLSKIDHVERIRIGTRTPVTLPQRITESLVRHINRFHHPGKRELVIVTHFEHQYELTRDSMQAVQKFRRYGIDVYNQMVFTLYNSRRFEAASLRHKLRLAGVTPYYTFNTKGKEETSNFRTPIARLLQEQKEEARLMPGMVRTDEVVFNVPGLGKNYLRAEQHHDVISILPDGRRVYEFHPWEKNLSLVDTYVYTDVSIYDYLQRLKKLGESTSEYKTIWYYY